MLLTKCKISIQLEKENILKKNNNENDITMQTL